MSTVDISIPSHVKNSGKHPISKDGFWYKPVNHNRNSLWTSLWSSQIIDSKENILLLPQGWAISYEAWSDAVHEAERRMGHSANINDEDDARLLVDTMYQMLIIEGLYDTHLTPFFWVTPQVDPFTEVDGFMDAM